MNHSIGLVLGKPKSKKMSGFSDFQPGRQAFSAVRACSSSKADPLRYRRNMFGQYCTNGSRRRWCKSDVVRLDVSLRMTDVLAASDPIGWACKSNRVYSGMTPKTVHHEIRVAYGE